MTTLPHVLRLCHHLFCISRTTCQSSRCIESKNVSFATQKTRLKSFKGTFNVYRRFSKDFFQRAVPLNAMTPAEVPPYK